MKTVAELDRAYASADRWVQRALRLSTMAGWTMKAGGCAALLGVLIGGRFGLTMLLQVCWPCVWFALGLLGCTLLVGIPMSIRRAVVHDRLLELKYRKHYPPGCTCIHGALTDNPSCPHHRDGGML